MVVKFQKAISNFMNNIVLTDQYPIKIIIFTIRVQCFNVH